MQVVLTTRVLAVDPAEENTMYHSLYAETLEWQPSVEGRSSCLLVVFVKALLVANHKDSCCLIEFLGLFRRILLS